MKPIDLFAACVAALLATLFIYYRVTYRRPEVAQREVTEYLPPASWLRAGILFCCFYLVSWATGTLQAILTMPLASSDQLADSRWWLWVIGLFAFILVAYWGIWARYTIRFDRKLDVIPQLLYGLVWGTALGQLLVVAPETGFLSRRPKSWRHERWLRRQEPCPHEKTRFLTDRLSSYQK